MVTSTYEISRDRPYHFALFGPHGLLQQREDWLLASPDAREAKEREYYATMLRHMRSLASQQTGITKLSDVKSYAQAILSVSTGHGREMFNSRERFNYKKDGYTKLEPACPEIEEYELPKLVMKLYNMSPEEIRGIGGINYRDTESLYQTMREVMASYCELREITQKPPTWFIKKCAESGLQDEVQERWDEELRSLCNHEDNYFGGEDFEGFKKLRLAKDENDKGNPQHCYGLFFPWEMRPACATYTYAAQSSEPGYYRDQLHEMLDEQKQTDDPERLYIYGTTISTRELKGVTLPTILYRKLFENFKEGLVARGIDAEAEMLSQHRLVTLSPLRGFPKWLKEHLDADGLFAPKENNKVKKLMQDASIEHKIESAADLVKHYMKFEEDAESKQVTVTSKYPKFKELPKKERKAASKFFHALLEDLGRQYVFEAWESKRNPGDKLDKPNIHADPSIHLHASGGAKLVNVAFQESPEEWKYSAGMTANFAYFPHFPKSYSRLYERCGWLEEEPGWQIDMPISEAYWKRESLTQPDIEIPQLLIDAKQAKLEARAAEKEAKKRA